MGGGLQYSAFRVLHPTPLRSTTAATETCSRVGKRPSFSRSFTSGSWSPQKCATKRRVMLRAAIQDTCCPMMLVTSVRNGSILGRVWWVLSLVVLVGTGWQNGLHGIRAMSGPKRASTATRCCVACERSTGGGGVCGIVGGTATAAAAVALLFALWDALRRFGGGAAASYSESLVAATAVSFTSVAAVVMALIPLFRLDERVTRVAVAVAVTVASWVFGVGGI